MMLGRENVTSYAAWKDEIGTTIRPLRSTASASRGDHGANAVLARADAGDDAEVGAAGRALDVLPNLIQLLTVLRQSIGDEHARYHHPRPTQHLAHPMFVKHLSID